MSEIQNTQLENIHTIKESIPGLDQEKYDTLKDYPNFSTFESLLKTDFENKDKLIQLLNSISNIKLKLYFKSGFTLIDQKGINEFINDPKFASLIEKQTSQESKQTSQESKQTSQESKQTSQESKQTSQEKLKTFQDTYPIFKEGLTKYAQNNDKELLELLKKFENSYDNTDIDAFLTYFNSNPQKLQEIFSSLKDDEKSYTAFYSFLESTNDPNLLSRLQTIPKDPKDFTKQENRLDKLLDTSPYFPNTSKDDIKKVGNILTTQIDEKKGYNKVIETGELPPSSYIEGKNGYHIKTDIVSPKLLDIRAAFTNEKLKIEGQIQNIENKLSSLSLENIENTQNQIQIEIENLKQKQENGGLSFEEEIKFEGLQKDLKEIESLKQKIEELQNQISKLNEELNQREEEFLKYYTLSLGKEGESIDKKDKQSQETLKFIDDIGLTHIPYVDFIKLQNFINLNQSSLGLSKPLDINNGFTQSDSIEKTKNNDREFIGIFNKLLPKESQVSIDNSRAGKLGDTFSSENFAITLQNSGLLKRDGRLSMEFVTQKLIKN